MQNSVQQVIMYLKPSDNLIISTGNFGWQDAEGGETALIASPLLGSRKGLGQLLKYFIPCLHLHRKQLSRALPYLLACHHLPFSAWASSIRRATLNLAYSPGCSADGHVYV